MHRNFVLLIFVVLLLSGCFHDDVDKAVDKPSEEPLHTAFASGNKNIMGGERQVGVFYQEGLDSAGKDGEYFTGDDLIRTYGASSIINSTTNAGFSVNSPGKDQIWFTDDDVIYEAGKFESLESGGWISTRFGAPGLDGKWLTADDVVSNYTLRTSILDDANITAEKTFYYTDPGSDGLWFTEDDVFTDVDLTRVDSENQVTDRMFDFGVGEDGVLFTDDDTVSYYSYRERILQENPGTRTTSKLRSLAGNDGYLDTADDVSSLTTEQRITMNVSAFGFETSHTFSSLYEYYDDAGSDGVWLTDDDRQTSKSTIDILDQNQLGFSARHIEWLSGSDGNYTGDGGIVARYSLQVVDSDATKSTSRQTYYRSAGVDEIWFSEDDVVSETHTAMHFWTTIPTE